jgi:DNA-binding MarR family transcriptional regulator
MSPPPLLAVIMRAEMAMAHQLREHLRREGYGDQTLAQSRIFGSIPPDGIRLTDLAERAQLTKQAVGELVDQMEAAGYVERSPDPGDARAKLIGFTAKGWRAVETALTVFGDMENLLAEHLGADRLATTREVLELAPSIVAGAAPE